MKSRLLLKDHEEFQNPVKPKVLTGSVFKSKTKRDAFQNSQELNLNSVVIPRVVPELYPPTAAYTFSEESIFNA